MLKHEVCRKVNKDWKKNSINKERGKGSKGKILKHEGMQKEEFNKERDKEEEWRKNAKVDQDLEKG